MNTKKNFRSAFVLPRITGLLIAIALALPAVFPNTGIAAEYASAKNDGVNVRSGPGTNNEVLWEIFKNYPLKVLRYKKKWAEVEDFEGDKGWIFASLLSKSKTVIVRVETANMRSGPGKDNDVIATVRKGVVFKPVDRRGNWVKVSYKGDITGWIYKTLLWP